VCFGYIYSYEVTPHINLVPVQYTPARMKATTTVLCFGDSWTDGNAYGLREQLKKHGHSSVKVINNDFWGSTAEYFATNPKLLPSAVTSNKADFVLLSMGGNDFKNIYWKNQQYTTLPWNAVQTIEKHIRVVLDHLFEEHPNIKVVTYGYDFPGCVEQFITGRWDNDKELTSSVKALAWMYKTVGVRVINYSALHLGDSLEKLSKEYIKKGFSFTYVPLWGSLQSAAEGKPDVAPVLSLPSPNKYMNDPIHANSQGFNILLGNLYKAYFGKVLV